ncbi:MAG: ATP-binding protein [Proteobacteria bacterium]|nr:ATP-binding protein [Pseudomonadota bacterium]
MKSGIQTRLILTTTIVLSVFLSLTGMVLDRSFSASIFAGAESQLRQVVYSLMGVAEEHPDGVRFASELPHPSLNQPESGLYAAVYNLDTSEGWRSPSARTTVVGFPEPSANLTPGDFVFSEADDGGVDRFFLSYTVIWEDPEQFKLTFHVATDQAPFAAAIRGFRRNLYLGLGLVTLLFVGAQLVAIRWGLRPLRTMADEVRDLEEGKRDKLSALYPSELHGLAQNLDRFVQHEQRSRTRYRNALDDLAHSLKTPLAVIRNALGEHNGTSDRQLVQEQLERMESTVMHQLTRASISGPTVVGHPVDLTRVLQRLVRALQTAYADRHIEVSLDLPERLIVRGDERDFMEIFGNLLENAFKYTGRAIRVSGSKTTETVVGIDDDGPGISANMRAEVLNRGTRADEIQPGQGIGLAVVAELVKVYGGKLSIQQSDLGGARVEFRI